MERASDGTLCVLHGYARRAAVAEISVLGGKTVPRVSIYGNRLERQLVRYITVVKSKKIDQAIWNIRRIAKVLTHESVIAICSLDDNESAPTEKGRANPEPDPHFGRTPVRRAGL